MHFLFIVLLVWSVVLRGHVGSCSYFEQTEHYSQEVHYFLSVYCKRQVLVLRRCTTHCTEASPDVSENYDFRRKQGDLSKNHVLWRKRGAHDHRYDLLETLCFFMIPVCLLVMSFLRWPPITENDEVEQQVNSSRLYCKMNDRWRCSLCFLGIILNLFGAGWVSKTRRRYYSHGKQWKASKEVCSGY